MEPLQCLPIERWPELQEKLKKFWPSNAAGFYELKVNFQHHHVRDGADFRVYCPYGNLDHGFVATKRLEKKEGCFLNIFSTSEDTSKLEEALLNTKLINWTKNMFVYFLPPQVKNMFEKIIHIKVPGVHLREHPLILYFMDKSRKPFEDVSCPPNTYLANVSSEHTQHINQLWPHKYRGSDILFSKLIQSNLGQGLFSTEDNSLVAWVFIGDYGHILHLYCEECHRKKGYAEYLMKHLVNDQLNQGNDLFGFVVPNNDKSAGLFKKLNFDECGKLSCYGILQG